MTYLHLVFNTSLGSKRSMRIYNPATGLSSAEIEAAVTQLIANDVFDPAKGALTGVNQLELVTIARQTIV